LGIRIIVANTDKQEIDMSNINMVGAVARNFGVAWNYRRKIVTWTLIFCAGMIMLAFFYGTCANVEVRKEIVNSAFLLAGAVIGSYVFGAVWNDKNAATVGAASSIGNQAPAIGEIAKGTGNVDNPDDPTGMNT
jgi:hypothetical protein